MEWQHLQSSTGYIPSGKTSLAGLRPLEVASIVMGKDELIERYGAGMRRAFRLRFSLGDGLRHVPAPEHPRAREKEGLIITDLVENLYAPIIEDGRSPWFPEIFSCKEERAGYLDFYRSALDIASGRFHSHTEEDLFSVVSKDPRNLLVEPENVRSRREFSAYLSLLTTDAKVRQDHNLAMILPVLN